MRTEPHAQRRGQNEFMTVRVVLAWEFPLGALRWSRKSQMPCERGICVDRRSHDVRRDTPLPATGRPLSGTLLHAATSRLRVPWACVGFGTVVPQVAVSRHAAPSKWGGRCRAQDHRVQSNGNLGPWSHDDNRPAEFNDTAGTWFEDEDARLRPIRLRPIRLRPAGRCRNWPKSKLAEVEQMVCALSLLFFLFFLFFCFFFFFLLLFLLLLSVFVPEPRTLNPEP